MISENKVIQNIIYGIRLIIGMIDLISDIVNDYTNILMLAIGAIIAIMLFICFAVCIGNTMLFISNWRKKLQKKRNLTQKNKKNIDNII